MKPIHTIDDVIAVLDDIIAESKTNNDPLGYFAALYKKVTIKVKEGIEDNFFADGPRMERLDVIFASRYIDAYFAYQENKAVTISWKKAFDLSKRYWPIVLQHLLIGMNAHINLDLGIAAAEVSKGNNIEDLKGDFDKINDILSSLVKDVENDLAEIWPTLKKILKLTRKVDNFLIDFSMELARDGAWKFAKEIAGTPKSETEILIKNRDNKVGEKANIITDPGLIARIILIIIRLGERGTVLDKINDLNE
ncbi:DUF5995 family protein [Aquimarina sediminis]|uniref:DUF5995 family protein n=1 Tax=Aquimarina sediminis TaxID=2070536 RepID=UPI000CA0582A|nr:DUF5995 family protein [Aquimarina sediminis]